METKTDREALGQTDRQTEIKTETQRQRETENSIFAIMMTLSHPMAVM